MSIKPAPRTVEPLALAFATVLRRLRRAGVDAGHDLEWRLLARQMDAAGRIKVGEYALAADLTPRQLLQRLRERGYRAVLPDAATGSSALENWEINCDALALPM